MHTQRIFEQSIPWKELLNYLFFGEDNNIRWRKLLFALRDRKTTIVIRNYCIVLGCVTLLSLGLAEVYNHPSRVAQRDRLNNYGYFIGAGLVDYANRAIYR
ncbi:hypothetical protein Ple7327_2500 [Pleurocapsa sp. PCC 7327]|nr:hypothetical protein Ple7327_2500 [Pleurocapsa sp. PCC 7327]